MEAKSKKTTPIINVSLVKSHTFSTHKSKSLGKTESTPNIGLVSPKNESYLVPPAIKKKLMQFPQSPSDNSQPRKSAVDDFNKRVCMNNYTKPKVKFETQVRKASTIVEFHD